MATGTHSQRALWLCGLSQRAMTWSLPSPFEVTLSTAPSCRAYCHGMYLPPVNRQRHKVGVPGGVGTARTLRLLPACFGVDRHHSHVDFLAPRPSLLVHCTLGTRHSALPSYVTPEPSGLRPVFTAQSWRACSLSLLRQAVVSCPESSTVLQRCTQATPQGQ